MAERFGDDFKRFFLRGLAAVLPAIVTVAILVWLFAQIQRFIGRYINAGVQWVVLQFSGIIAGTGMDWYLSDAAWDEIKATWGEYHLGWIGFVLGFVAIYIFGRFVASILGRGLWRMIERTVVRLPVIKQIYPYVKQVVDFLLSERKLEFSRVVAVEYPRKGIWSLGLVTGPGMRTLHQNLGGDLLTVFIPSSPTPVTGYTITVNRHDVVDLPISIDNALRFTVSGGVIMPTNQQRSRAEIEQARQGVFSPPQETDEKETSQ